MSDVLKGETIIYFGPGSWAGLWRNRHQLMSRLARHNNVWYVEPPTMIRQLFTGRNRSGAASRTHRSRLFTRDPSGVKVFHSPWWLPLTGRSSLGAASIRYYLGVLSLAAGLYRQSPIVWFSRPNMLAYMERLPAKLTIYHVVDEYSGYCSLSEEERQLFVLKETEFLRRVDVVIVVTSALLHQKSRHNPNIHHVPNAVDFAAYATRDAPIPSDLAEVRRPIVGYSGLVAARLDFDLLEAGAEARPEWSFVFIGHVREDESQEHVRRLRALPNVHLLGQKSVEDTPRYVRHFDVCTIPYSVNLRAQHASPLKLYEYAAASKPIVATDFAAARDFPGYIEIIHNKDEFVAACERCLKAESISAPIADNRRFAANNTWEHRVKQISRIVRSYTTPETGLPEGKRP